MTITVLRPGLLSSFQDLGRCGSQHLGVPVGGAMDSRAHRLANIVAGNAGDEATLEVTLTGPALRFDAPGCVAISGGQLGARLNGVPVPNNRPLVVRAGDTLDFAGRMSGLRAYIAWHGGIELPTVLGSRSTYLRGGFGGYKGRALKSADVLAMKADFRGRQMDALEREIERMKIYLPAILGTAPRETIRALRGAHTDLFTPESIEAFFNGEYRIRPESERMGYRLEGPVLKLKRATQLLSEATSFGSVQVPPDGNPIVLMADRQTTGGYAKIAHVATVDLPAIAQCMPGERLRFRETSLQDAQRLDQQREQAFERLFQALAPLRQHLAGR